MSPMIGKNLFRALQAAGLADEMTRRVTIDVPCNDVVTVYIERYGDAHMLDVIPAIAEDPSLVVEQVERPTVPDGMVDVTKYGDSEPQYIPGALSEKDTDQH